MRRAALQDRQRRHHAPAAAGGRRGHRASRCCSPPAPRPPRRSTQAIEWTGLGPDKLVLLACTLTYPTPDEDAHFARIPAFRARVRPLPDRHVRPHARRRPARWMTAALGGVCIEKHYTLDKTLGDVPDHAMSVDPPELARDGRAPASARPCCVGDAVDRRARLRASRRAQNARRSIVLERDVRGRRGAIAPDDLGFKRPGTGIAPSEADRVIGAAAARGRAPARHDPDDRATSTGTARERRAARPALRLPALGEPRRRTRPALSVGGAGAHLRRAARPRRRDRRHARRATRPPAARRWPAVFAYRTATAFAGRARHADAPAAATCRSTAPSRPPAARLMLERSDAARAGGRRRVRRAAARGPGRAGPSRCSCSLPDADDVSALAAQPAGPHRARPAPTSSRRTPGPSASRTPTSVAYVLFTSGSTGRPEGRDGRAPQLRALVDRHGRRATRSTERGPLLADARADLRRVGVRHVRVLGGGRLPVLPVPEELMKPGRFIRDAAS